jgi:hypothetical protein
MIARSLCIFLLMHDSLTSFPQLPATNANRIRKKPAMQMLDATAMQEGFDKETQSRNLVSDAHLATLPSLRSFAPLAIFFPTS